MSTTFIRPKVSLRRRRLTALGESNPAVPYLFLLPHAVLFLMFTVYPVVFGLWVSMHRFDPLQAVQPFVGLEFYRNLFDPSTVQSQLFWLTVKNTAFFAALSVPLVVGYSLALALQLQRPVWGRTFFRAVFFLPGVLSGPVVAQLWRWVFDNQSGLLNAAIDQYLKLPPIAFLATEGLAWLPILVATVWASVGFNMTVYLAALTGISRSLYEAAELDGATSWTAFRFITLPLLAPTTLFVTVTTALGAFNFYNLITLGNPTRSTLGVIQYVAEEANVNVQYSSAAAMSFVFAALLLVLTVLQFRLMIRSGQPAERR